jgi:hypothetical protein
MRSSGAVIVWCHVVQGRDLAACLPDLLPKAARFPEVRRRSSYYRLRLGEKPTASEEERSTTTGLVETCTETYEQLPDTSLTLMRQAGCSVSSKMRKKIDEAGYGTERFLVFKVTRERNLRSFYGMEAEQIVKSSNL